MCTYMMVTHEVNQTYLTNVSKLYYRTHFVIC
jgi:hypothetical protein